MIEIKSIFIVILFFAIIYLLCAFYSADFSIKNWQEPVRFTNAYIGGVLSLFGGFAYYFENKN